MNSEIKKGKKFKQEDLENNAELMQDIRAGLKLKELVIKHGVGIHLINKIKHKFQIGKIYKKRAGISKPSKFISAK